MSLRAITCCNKRIGNILFITILKVLEAIRTKEDIAHQYVKYDKDYWVSSETSSVVLSYLLFSDVKVRYQ
jgi:hypothetical protein